VENRVVINDGIRFLVVGLIAVAVGCAEGDRRGERPSATPMADRGTLTIRRPAATRIGLQTDHVLRQTVRNTIAATGWLTAEPGHEVVVQAPVTGFIRPAEPAGSFPLGQQVVEQQTLGTLHVFLSPQEQAQVVAAKEDTDTVIRQSRASLQIAQGQLVRLEKKAENAVPGTRLQELREVVARSKAAHDEALEKLPFLPEEPYGDAPRLRPTRIDAPIDGQLIRLFVSPGQLVLPGDPLCLVADWSTLWIRVPVFVADLARLQRDQSVDIVVPGQRTGRQAEPVTWPQPAEAGRQTVDLFYKIDNRRGDLRPGQAVAVTMPLGDRVSRLTVRRSAILWDTTGAASVYVQLDAEHFRRRKVELGPRTADRVVVRRGLTEDDVVVVVGAEALFSEEFRWQIPREDEDD